MSYEPRTIAFGAEVIHQPISLRPEVIQSIHNSLYQNRDHGYQNFQVAADGIHLSNPAQAPGSVSMVTFLPDRIILREEFRPCTVEEFAARLVSVTSISYRTLQVPMTLAQQFWTRSLVNTHHVRDSREFVANRMLEGGQSSLGCFRRPLFTLGLRYTFPQSEGNSQIVNLRIEPWPQDPRSLWLEVIGQLTHPTTVDNLPELSSGLYSTYKFLTGPTFDYIGQFDKP
jgi:hypothetical protein